jgi:hypothetical protein
MHATKTHFELACSKLSILDTRSIANAEHIKLNIIEKNRALLLRSHFSINRRAGIKQEETTNNPNSITMILEEVVDLLYLRLRGYYTPIFFHSTPSQPQILAMPAHKCLLFFYQSQL